LTWAGAVALRWPVLCGATEPLAPLPDCVVAPALVEEPPCGSLLPVVAGCWAEGGPLGVAAGWAKALPAHIIDKAAPNRIDLIATSLADISTRGQPRHRFL
jgi:hypothetical protein